MQALAAILIAAAAPAVPHERPSVCKVEQALYRLEGTPDRFAGFAALDRSRRPGSPLVLWLSSPGRTFWFSIGSAKASGAIYLLRRADRRGTPRGDVPRIPFHASRADRTTFAQPPVYDGEAPVAFLNPVATGRSSRRDFRPAARFVLAACNQVPL